MHPSASIMRTPSPSDSDRASKCIPKQKSEADFSLNWLPHLLFRISVSSHDVQGDIQHLFFQQNVHRILRVLAAAIGLFHALSRASV